MTSSPRVSGLLFVTMNVLAGGLFAAVVLTPSEEEPQSASVASPPSDTLWSTPVLFLVSGQDSADEIVGRAAARALGGQIRRIDGSALTPQTRRELSALSPDAITFVGGTTAVAEGTLDQLRGLTAGPVQRMGGVHRYSTAAMVATASFRSPVDQVVVVNGSTPPSAAEAMADAGGEGPVLFVDRDRLPPETAAALRELQPRKVVVIGSTGVVSDAVLRSLAGLTGAPVGRSPQ